MLPLTSIKQLTARRAPRLFLPLLAAAALPLSLPTKGAPAASTPYSVSMLNKNGTVPCDLSADGRIVGEVQSHAFYWSPTNQYIDLTPAATVENRALHVTSSGVVLGWSDTGLRLWLWDAKAQSLGCRSLDALHNGASDGWVLDGTGTDQGLPPPQINEGGVMAGTGLFNGRLRPYVAVYDQATGRITSITNLGHYPGSNPDPDTYNYPGANFALAVSPAGDIAGQLNAAPNPGWFISHLNYFQQGATDDENLAMQLINAAGPLYFPLSYVDGNYLFFANAAGQVAASNDIWSPAVFWDAANPNNPVTLSGLLTGLNAKGWVAGTTGRSSAFVFVPGMPNVTIPLGDLGGGGSSTATGGDFYPVRTINNAGQVVGESSPKGGASHAFVWQDLNNNRRSDPGEMRDLNNLIPKITGFLWKATHINDNGQIAGRTSQGNASYAFRLTPNP